MEEKQYDIVIIGSGDAGKTVAYAASKKGKKVAVIDKHPFGGTLGLRWCYSKKLLITGAESADLVRRMNDVGIRLGSGQVSWKEIMAWKRKHVNHIPENNKKSYEKRKIDVYQGVARFVDEQSVHVNEFILHAQYIHIAVGSKPIPLGVKGQEYIVDNEEFLNLDQLPKRIIFIGGGFISFEFAHIAARAGSEVMILHRSERVLKRFDPDLVDLLIKASENVGIIVKTNHPLVKVEHHGKSYVVLTQENGREIRENGDLIVHGAGRMPNIDSLDLEKANIAYTKNGIVVNRYLQNITNPYVYAAGDAADTGPMLTPVGKQEGKIAAYNILHKTKRRYPDYTFIPSVVFTIPHLSMAGYTEEKARRKGLQFNVVFHKIHDWVHNERVNMQFAASKVLIQKKTNRIIGAHILGEKSDELANMFAFVMQNKMTSEDIKKSLYAYPTALSSIQYMV